MKVSRLEVREGVALLTIDNQPVNALSQPVRKAILSAVQRLTADSELRALVIACAGRTFIAGADIREFGKPSLEPFLTTVVDTIDRSEKPILAALHGTALGGGLEVAMACHYRVAAESTSLGLPEVKLGLMPGARGTQQLPRLVGAPKALEMIAFGMPISAADALAAGLVDRLAEDPVAGALDLAATVVNAPVPRTSERSVPPFDAGFFGRFAEHNARKFRRLDAPPAIIAAVQAATELPFEEGARRERELFLELRAGSQCEALRYVFFAERAAAKVAGLEGVSSRPVATIGVVGAGTMGTGIAVACLIAGFTAILVEQDSSALERGLQKIDAILARNVAAGRMTDDDGEAARARLTASLDFASLTDAELIIEAASETIEVKRDIFARLDALAKPRTVLATNTSYLDIDAIAAATGRPADVLGLHFFSPAHIMKLVEIVRGKATSPDLLATALAVTKRLGKIAVVARNGYRFIGNRMLAARRREVERMVVEGASPYDFDRVAEAFGLPMGPFRIGDLAGLDLGWSAESSTASTLRECFNEAGRRGQKSGQGFYDYDALGEATPSDRTLDIIAEFAQKINVERRTFSDDELLAGLLWPMVDEGLQLLDEGIAERSSDIDVVWINGYGWPAWTGGPMYHAEQIGYRSVAEALRSIGLTPSTSLLTRASTS